MDFVETRCVTILRYQLLSVGLWPYLNTKLVLLQRIVMFAAFAAFTIMQLSAFAMKDCNFHCILRNILYSCLPMMYIGKYTFFMCLRKQVRNLLDNIRCDWNSITCRQEHGIIEADANSARTMVIILTVFTYQGMFGCVFLQILPGVLDMVAPLNGTRPKVSFVAPDFANEQNYLVVSLQVDVIGFVGSTITIGTETLFILSVQHTCSLFNIVCHRIDTTLDNALLEISGSERNRIIRSRIVSAIQMHHRALEFFEDLKGTFMLHYFVSIGYVIFGLSVLLFRESSMLLLTVGKDELLINTFLILAHGFYMFYVNYIGQMIIDRSSNIFTKIYETLWFTAPVTTRKILIFFMGNSMKPCSLVPGSIFVFCMEGFTMMVSTAVSYFTVVFSVLTRDHNTGA